MASIELGKSHIYKDTYDASLLVPIERESTRKSLSYSDFYGHDEWNAFELSWLDLQGLPQVAIAEFRFDAASINIVESKSFKYYLNSFNQTRFAGFEDVSERLQTDLSAACEGQVSVRLRTLDDQFSLIAHPPGRCVDHIETEIDAYQPDNTVLIFDKQRVQNEQIYSHLLKSNCPVTGQPDWATLWVQYSGPKIVEQSFLKYVVSFRQYQGFHESCVERVFCDLWEGGDLSSLCVYARYTRRGGLDINPIRFSRDFSPEFKPFGRLARQ